MTGGAETRLAVADAGASRRGLAVGAVVAILGAAVQGIGNYNLPVMSNLLYLAVALVVALRARE